MAGIDSKVSCKECRYYRNADIMGRCHRFPEAINKTMNDWCGEWKSLIPPPVIEYMVQDLANEPNEARAKILEEAAKVQPKPKGRPRKVENAV